MIAAILAIVFLHLHASISNELHSSRCVPKAISPVTMNLQCQRSRQQQTRDLHRRWDSAPDHSVGPWVVVHFVWQTNTDGWPCSTHDKMFSIHNCQRTPHVCNADWGSVRKSKLLLKWVVWILCSAWTFLHRTPFELDFMKVFKLYLITDVCPKIK